MYPIGTSAINDRTIGESAQGLAEYVKRQVGNGESGSGRGVRSRTTLGIDRGISPSFVPKLWWLPASTC